MEKLTVKELHELLTDEQIREAFIARQDIQDLPPDEQEVRWQAHRQALEPFFELMANHHVIIL